MWSRSPWLFALLVLGVVILCTGVGLAVYFLVPRSANELPTQIISKEGQNLYFASNVVATDNEVAVTLYTYDTGLRHLVDTTILPVIKSGRTDCIASKDNRRLYLLQTQTQKVIYLDVSSKPYKQKAAVTLGYPGLRAGAITPDNKYLYVTCPYGLLQLDGDTLEQLQFIPVTKVFTDPHALAMNAQGDRLYIGSLKGTITAWNISNGAMLTMFGIESIRLPSETTDFSIRKLIVSADDTLLLTIPDGAAKDDSSESKSFLFEVDLTSSYPYSVSKGAVSLDHAIDFCLSKDQKVVYAVLPFNDTSTVLKSLPMDLQNTDSFTIIPATLNLKTVNVSAQGAIFTTFQNANENRFGIYGYAPTDQTFFGFNVLDSVAVIGASNVL